AAPDAAAYGDEGSDTLGNLARARGGLRLPNLTAAGLGCLAALDGVPPVVSPEGAWGIMQPASAGKDSTTGHWEIAGLHLARPFLGTPGAYERTANRRDYSLAPPGETLLDALAVAGVPRAGVGKVDDLFAGRHLRARHTASNAEGIRAILDWLQGNQGGLLFA